MLQDFPAAAAHYKNIIGRHYGPQQGILRYFLLIAKYQPGQAIVKQSYIVITLAHINSRLQKQKTEADKGLMHSVCFGSKESISAL